MKKILLTSIIIFSLIQTSYASFGDTPKTISEADKIKASEPVLVTVTEKIPWADCTCTADGAQTTALPADQAWPPTPGTWEAACGKVETRKYVCKVGKWLSSFQVMIASIIRWLVNIILLLGVLAIVWVGIMMSFYGSSDEWWAKAAKKWAVNIIVGLIILFTFRYILGLLAPWIYK